MSPTVASFKRNNNYDISTGIGAPGMGYLVYRLLCQMYTKTTVYFLPVHHPTREDMEKPLMFGRQVRHVRTNSDSSLFVQGYGTCAKIW